jgi:oligopeptide/dipeptide ABC transporter ATP-binding protein
MYLGSIVEIGARDDVFQHPLHPYTNALLSVVSIPDPALERAREVRILSGEVPSPIDLPSGCRFRTRCPFASEVCERVEPQLKDAGTGHLVACHLVHPPQ